MAKVSIKEAEKLRVDEDFVLADVDPASTPGVDEDDVDDAFEKYDDEIADLQDCLYANGRAGNENAGSILLVLQGMDTSGKGGIIRHVVGDLLDPQGRAAAGQGGPVGSRDRTPSPATRAPRSRPVERAPRIAEARDVHSGRTIAGDAAGPVRGE